MLKSYLILIVKGIAMGAANVIPGVSGGTIALIIGIFERLIDAIKSFNLTAARLLLKFRFREFAQHTDLGFLVSVFAGVAIAILSLARLFDYLFEHHPQYIWGYFFGLVLASVWFVGKTVTRWSVPVWITFFVGTAIAVWITLMNPASENSSVIYLLLCGVVAVCSMILPGLSGSFVLILMGNYQLVMIDAVNELNLRILIPVVIGAAGGLLGFSHLLSWVFKRYRNETISLLTGFILGSVSILWPWQRAVYLTDDAGEMIMKGGEPVVMKYLRYIPEWNMEYIWVGLVALAGVLSIWAIESLAAAEQKKA
ncbi:MAG: DUF368 domain-containing protein [Bacteroidales bacterium]